MGGGVTHPGVGVGGHAGPPVSTVHAVVIGVGDQLMRLSVPECVLPSVGGWGGVLGGVWGRTADTAVTCTSARLRPVTLTHRGAAAPR